MTTQTLGRAPLSVRDEAEVLARLEILTRLMDEAFVLPGTNVRVGLDAAIGLVPGIGDLLSASLSSYLVWEAHRLGAPRLLVARMLGNVAIDAVVGAVPLLGDAFDVLFRANRKNMRLLRRHLEKSGRAGAIDAEYRVVENAPALRQVAR